MCDSWINWPPEQRLLFSALALHASSARPLWLVFRSDSSVERRGFVLNWRTAGPSAGGAADASGGAACGALVTRQTLPPDAFNGSLVVPLAFASASVDATGAGAGVGQRPLLVGCLVAFQADQLSSFRVMPCYLRLWHFSYSYSIKSHILFTIIRNI